MAGVTDPSAAGTGHQGTGVVDGYNNTDGASDLCLGTRLREHETARPRSSKAQQSESKAFPFLQLPAELRNTIYELALSQPGGSWVRIGKSRCSDTDIPGLIRFYSRSLGVCHRTVSLSRCFARIGRSTAKLSTISIRSESVIGTSMPSLNSWTWCRNVELSICAWSALPCLFLDTVLAAL